MTKMSDLLLPPGVRMPEAIQTSEVPSEDIPIEERGRMLPKAVGWKILCTLPPADETFENSQVLKPELVKKQEEFTTVVLFVVDVGPDAYKDADKYPSGPWCKPGDFILVRAYAGTRLKVYGTEFRFINDDQVEGVVDDPRGITRA
jgi:co-chaperonin GroES (HSP10)